MPTAAGIGHAHSGTGQTCNQCTHANLNPWPSWNVGATTSINHYHAAQTIWLGWNSQITFTNSVTSGATGGQDVWFLDNQRRTHIPGIITTANQAIYMEAIGSWDHWNRDAHGRLLTHEERVARQAEEVRRHEEQQRVYAEQRAVAAKVAAEADARAEKLLIEHLNPEQREQYKLHKHFYLYSKGKKYRVDKMWAGHVKLVDEKTNEPIEQLCVHPVERIPDIDNMLIAKLNLEADPEAYRKIANITRLRRAA